MSLSQDSRLVDFDRLKTMTYEVTGGIARITFNRPEAGNAIVADPPLQLAAVVERADLDPAVHVILVAGRGAGFLPHRQAGRGLGLAVEAPEPADLGERNERLVRRTAWRLRQAGIRSVTCRR